MICIFAYNNFAQSNSAKSNREVETGLTEVKGNYDALKLQNQVCFPLYACSKELVRQYGPYLKELNLTYTQYIVMMVLWEEKQVNETFLCGALCLKTNTLTPLLKKLEGKGYVHRRKDKADERNLVITLTDEGKKLREKALCVPETIAAEFHLTPEEAASMYRILYKMLDEEKTRMKGE